MTTAAPTLADRLVEMVPKTYRQELARMVRQVRDRLPPVVIERRLAAIERRMEHGLKEMEARLGAVERRMEHGFKELEASLAAIERKLDHRAA